MRDCRFRNEVGCARSFCGWSHGGLFLCDVNPAPKTASGRVSVSVDSFDYYCITTLCPVIVFADHRDEGKCPACKQLGEMIGGNNGGDNE